MNKRLIILAIVLVAALLGGAVSYLTLQPTQPQPTQPGQTNSTQPSQTQVIETTAEDILHQMWLAYYHAHIGPADSEGKVEWENFTEYLSNKTLRIRGFATYIKLGSYMGGPETWAINLVGTKGDALMYALEGIIRASFTDPSLMEWVKNNLHQYPAQKEKEVVEVIIEGKYVSTKGTTAVMKVI